MALTLKSVEAYARVERSGRILLASLLETPPMYSRLHHKYPGLRLKEAVLPALDRKSTRHLEASRFADSISRWIGRRTVSAVTWWIYPGKKLSGSCGN